MAKKKSRVSGLYLAVAVFCESVLDDKDNVLSAIRIIDVIKLKVDPATLEKAKEDKLGLRTEVTVLLMFKSSDVSGEKKLRIQVITPSEKRLKHSPEFPLTLLGANTGANMRIKLAVPFEEPGQYWYEVSLDGKLITRMPLRVDHLPVDSPAPAETESDSSSSGAASLPKRKR